MKARYAHTNLIAHDVERLASFYTGVFGCVPLPPARDLAGTALEAGTGVPGARLRGMHLRLPGHGDAGPTLELFQYSEVVPQTQPVANRAGYGHIAFAVDSVDLAVEAVLAAGGSRVGEAVALPVDGAGTVRFAYVRDPEGNIVELQSWS